jgi:hypothetical protein
MSRSLPSLAERHAPSKQWPKTGRADLVSLFGCAGISSAFLYWAISAAVAGLPLMMRLANELPQMTRQFLPGASLLEVFLIYVSNSDSLMEGLMFCIKRRAFNSSCKLVGEDQRYPPEEPVVLLTREVVDIT